MSIAVNGEENTSSANSLGHVAWMLACYITTHWSNEGARWFVITILLSNYPDYPLTRGEKLQSIFASMWTLVPPLWLYL